MKVNFFAVVFIFSILYVVLQVYYGVLLSQSQLGMTVSEDKAQQQPIFDATTSSARRHMVTDSSAVFDSTLMSTIYTAQSATDAAFVNDTFKFKRRNYEVFLMTTARERCIPESQLSLERLGMTLNVGHTLSSFTNIVQHF